MEAKQIQQATQEHINFIRANGDRHIRQESLDYYKQPNTGEQILVECRLDNTLVGISFVARRNGHYDYSITVVGHEHRRQGIGTLLARTKKDIAPNMASMVAMDNVPSVKICDRIYECKKLQDGDKYIYYDGGIKCAE